jgi:hypothetical protein
MSLMDAQQYDEARDRRRRRRIISFVLIALIVAWVGYHFRHYPERRVVHKFFTALEEKDVERAYALWMQDPDWKQHPAKYANYSFGDFYRDWGPSGDRGGQRKIKRRVLPTINDVARQSAKRKVRPSQ